MPSGVLRAGSTFRFSDRDDDHLYVVISDPREPQVVVVNLTTIRRFSDTSCSLVEGDHPFVVHDTCVAFQYAVVASTEELEAMIESGDAVPDAPMSNEVMLRIWEGAAITRFLSLRCKEILASQGLV